MGIVEFAIVSYNTSGVTVRDQLVMNGMDINFNQYVSVITVIGQ